MSLLSDPVRLSLPLSLVVLLLPAGASLGQSATVEFSGVHQTLPGQSVYVVGSLPELGGNDITRAVRLEPSQFPLWRGTIELPAGVDYSYQLVVRSNAAGQGSNTANGSAIGPVITGSTPADPGEVGVSIYARLTLENPVLFWRQDGAAFNERVMIPAGPGRAPGETLWYAPPVGSSARPLEWFVRDRRPDGSLGARSPVFSTPTTTLPAALLQDGLVYTYVPAANPGRPRRDYLPATPPSIVSTHLGESRRYRVFLPRGYDQHTDRRYPVLYMHDGQNVFEDGAFGSWNSDVDLEAEANAGRAREIIVVAVDHTDRFRDYIPGPGSDAYARFLRDELKPLIDAQYRTLPGRATTATAGSSLGGVISFELGWDYEQTFGGTGAFSGAWQVASFVTRARTDARRQGRFYLDSGDSGTANDNHDLTYALRDAMMSRAQGPYVLEGDLRHAVGFGDQHNEAAWDRRFPFMLSFLFPTGDEDVSALLALPGPACAAALRADVNWDGAVSAADFSAWVAAFNSAAPPADQNADGLVTAADFSAWVGNFNSVCPRG